MKHITIGLLAVLALSVDGWGCRPYPEQGDTFGSAPAAGSVVVAVEPFLTLPPPPDGMGAALGSALSRWAQATCLPFSVGLGGKIHLRYARDGELPQGTQGRTSGKRTEPTIAIRHNLANDWMGSVLTHELWHAISFQDGHTEDGVTSSPLSNPYEPLTASALEVVCGIGWDCECFIPEE